MKGVNMFFKFLCMKLKKMVIEMSKAILSIAIVFGGLMLMIASCSMIFGLFLWSITFGQLFNIPSLFTQEYVFGFFDLGAFGGMFMLLLFMYTFAVRDLTNWFIQVADEYKTYKNIKKYKEIKNCTHNKVIGLLLICGMLGLVGCDATQTDLTGTFSLPPELKDYKVFRITSTDTTCLYVLVKNKEVVGVSTTGKSPIHVVIDGEEYSKVEKVKLEKE
jgi:hypothetical protein